MRTTQQRSITVPKDMADVVINANVTSGKHATESEVIRDGLRVLIARLAAEHKKTRATR